MELQHGSIETDVYIVEPTQGKGLGMFAKKNINQGTRILEDEILISLLGVLSKEQKQKCVQSFYNSWPLDRKQAFMELSNPGSSRATNDVFDLFCKFNANAFEISTMPEHHDPTVRYIVGLRASRINHSCMPNAYLDENTNIDRITVHALFDIPAKEEITVSYCLPHYSRDIRMRDILRYDFDCGCVVCERRLTEPRRVLMEEIGRSLYHSHANETWDLSRDPLSRVLQMVELMEREGLNVGALSALYEQAAYLYIRRGEHRTALTFAKRKYEAELLRLGLNAPLTQETVRFVSELRSRLSVIFT